MSISSAAHSAVKFVNKYMFNDERFQDPMLKRAFSNPNSFEGVANYGKRLPELFKTIFTFGWYQVYKCTKCAIGWKKVSIVQVEAARATFESNLLHKKYTNTFKIGEKDVFLAEREDTNNSGKLKVVMVKESGEEEDIFEGDLVKFIANCQKAVISGSRSEELYNSAGILFDESAKKCVEKYNRDNIDLMVHMNNTRTQTGDDSSDAENLSTINIAEFSPIPPDNSDDVEKKKAGQSINDNSSMDRFADDQFRKNISPPLSDSASSTRPDVSKGPALAKAQEAQVASDLGWGDWESVLNAANRGQFMRLSSDVQAGREVKVVDLDASALEAKAKNIAILNRLQEKVDALFSQIKQPGTNASDEELRGFEPLNKDFAILMASIQAFTESLKPSDWDLAFSTKVKQMETQLADLEKRVAQHNFTQKIMIEKITEELMIQAASLRAHLKEGKISSAEVAAEGKAIMELHKAYTKFNASNPGVELGESAGFWGDFPGESEMRTYFGKIGANNLEFSKNISEESLEQAKKTALYLAGKYSNHLSPINAKASEGKKLQNHFYELSKFVTILQKIIVDFAAEAR